VTTMKTMLWVLALSLIVGGAAWSVQLAFGEDGSVQQTTALPATAPASRPDAIAGADVQETR